jgi:predicted esterase
LTNIETGVRDFAGPNDEFHCYAKEGDVEGCGALYHNLKTLVSEEGMFDGVIGFSEGAAVAASLIVDHIRRTTAQESTPFAFKLAIFFCAANPVDADAVQRGSIELLDPGREGEVIAIPTAHIWARNDDVHPGFGQRLSALCSASTKEEYVHDLGHTIPGAQSGEGVSETTRVIRRTVERALEQTVR